MPTLANSARNIAKERLAVTDEIAGYTIKKWATGEEGNTGETKSTDGSA